MNAEDSDPEERRPPSDHTVVTLEHDLAALRALLEARIRMVELIARQLHEASAARITVHEQRTDRQFHELKKEMEFKRVSQKETFDETKGTLSQRVADAKLTADVQLNAMRERVQVVEQWRAVHQQLPSHAGATKEFERLEERLKPLENFRGQAGLIAAGLATMAGLIGAALARLLFGT
jgi:hypothetical protein